MISIVPSSDAWVAAACGDVPSLLLDHAHCEKKAAQTALKHVSRHPDWPGLADRLSRLAREELVHFERVLAELSSRGLDYRAQASAGYAAALGESVRAPSARRAGGPASWLGSRTVDEMLVGALIEARSHERFVRLAAAMPDAKLRALYDDLARAEERHGSLYVELAEEVAGDASSVSARLVELSAIEATIVARPGQPVRMHAGG